MYTDIGWRYRKSDYTSDGFFNKTELNGLVLETGINFCPRFIRRKNSTPQTV
jgi:hypothetical protein